jgi:hypothetical protein
MMLTRQLGLENRDIDIWSVQSQGYLDTRLYACYLLDGQKHRPRPKMLGGYSFGW